jgi:hypothetical protein
VFAFSILLIHSSTHLVSYILFCVSQLQFSFFSMCKIPVICSATLV